MKNINKSLIKKVLFAIASLTMVVLFQNFTPSKKEVAKPSATQPNRMPSSDKVAIDFNQLTDESSQLENDLARKMKTLNVDTDSQSK